MTSDVEAPASRSTVKETYDQVINDLKTAADLLPATVTVSMQPGKAAAYAMLSRVYLSMREYTDAEIYATKALQLSNTLMDYNSLTLSGSSFLPSNMLANPEIVYNSRTASVVFNGSGGAITDSTLYRSYDADDLRQTVFYRISNNNPYWRGAYSAGTDGNGIFDGLCTDELFLNRAECRARANNISGAMDDLNALLIKRWRTGTFTLVTATDAADALNKVLVERRKELVYRGLRWTDLRRLNLEGANITLKRIINNTTYTLPPNDLRWVLLIPEIEITRSGIPQNPR
jgi:tetratricopeptide (TPR) repeat protein